MRAGRSTIGSRDKSRLAHSAIATLVVTFATRNHVKSEIKIMHLCVSFLYVWIGNILDNFVWDIITNGFYIVVGYSLPRCDLRYMWNINIQYTIQRPCNPNVCKSSVRLRSSWVQIVRSYNFMHSNSFFLSLLFNVVIGELPSCFMNLLLKSFFVCISESQKVLCWGCNANSTLVT